MSVSFTLKLMFNGLQLPTHPSPKLGLTLGGHNVTNQEHTHTMVYWCWIQIDPLHYLVGPGVGSRSTRYILVGPGVGSRTTYIIDLVLDPDNCIEEHRLAAMNRPAVVPTV